MSKIFISHASEDKEEVVFPLASALVCRGMDVWLDTWDMYLGDGIRAGLERVIGAARYAVVVISPDYLRKNWTRRELDGLYSRESVDRKLILPVLHRMGVGELTAELPTLAGRVCSSTDRGVDFVASDIARAVENDAEAGSQRHLTSVDLLSIYRSRLISSSNEYDLLRLQYELEDFLRKFPSHPEIRILLGQVENAVAAIRPSRRGEPLSNRPFAKRLRSIVLPILLLALGVSVAISFAYFLLQLVLR